MGRVFEAFFALDALILFKATVFGPPELIRCASPLGTGILMAGKFNSGGVEANVSEKEIEGKQGTLLKSELGGLGERILAVPATVIASVNPPALAYCSKEKTAALRSNGRFTEWKQAQAFYLFEVFPIARQQW
jgi:hypothetical protein